MRWNKKPKKPRPVVGATRDVKKFAFMPVHIGGEVILWEWYVSRQSYIRMIRQTDLGDVERYYWHEIGRVLYDK